MASRGFGIHSIVSLTPSLNNFWVSLRLRAEHGVKIGDESATLIQRVVVTGQFVFQTFTRRFTFPMRLIANSAFALLILLLINLVMCQSDTPDPNATQRAAVDVVRTAWVQKAVQLAEEKRRAEERWVNEALAGMSKDARLGQLFMIGAYPSRGASSEKAVLKAIEDHRVGGVIFFQGGADHIARLTNQFQAKTRFPLMMAMDAEWGTNMRVSAATKFPRQLLMGALQNNALIYEFGKAVAEECKAMGIHINFAPVVDVNNNPANPVIGDRSFGEDRKNVTAKAYQYIKGLQDHGVMACAKHFPGHGDTDVDSHKDLPVIRHSLQRLDSIELYPFKTLAQHGVQSVMVAHLHIPAIDATPNVPVTLSRPAVTDLLQKKLGYKGLIFTDALDMRGVTKHFKDGETDLRALLAGNDVLLVPQDIPAAKRKIYAAIDSNLISWPEIDAHVRKILHAKYRLGLNNYTPVDAKNVSRRLNLAENKLLKQEIVGEALTLVDPENMMPLDARSVACLSIGGNSNAFQNELRRYGVTKQYSAGRTVPNSRLKALSKYKTVLISIHGLDRSIKRNFGISENIEQFVKKLSAKTKVMVVVFGSPYALRSFPMAQGAVVAYNNETMTQRLAARALAGALPFRGRLPITASAKFRYGMGKDTEIQKMPYATRPEYVGLDSKVLQRIDAIAAEMIREKAAPGCQVLIAKDGQIAFHRAYGHHTYAKKRRQRLENIYDLASVTKVAATTLALMRLVDEGKIDLDQPLSLYLSELRGTNKSSMTVREILVHQAKLKPWIPFYTRTLDEQKKPIMGRYYSTRYSSKYAIRVAENLYFAQSKVDSVIWQRIYDQDLRARSNYRYSDLGFYLFGKLVHRLTGKSLDRYVSETFYRPMGLLTTQFTPLKHGVPRANIIPTEDDQYFRYQVVQGDVHDMGAAMLGGVAGHAGLFSNAQDLAAIFQMLINGGEYGGKRYLKAATINQFITRHSQQSRRALGFDRKEKSDKPRNSINVAYQASDRTFGHQGFTGIGAWADPDNNMVYLFLSNRTFPSGENMTLIRRDIRSRIQEVAYEALMAVE